jgi:hypothetical protein
MYASKHLLAREKDNIIKYGQEIEENDMNRQK